MSRVGSEAGFLAKQSSIYAIGNGLQRGTSLVLLPVYTHYLTTTDYGIKELLTITTEVVAVLVATAVSMALYRIYFQFKEPEMRRQVISSAYVTMAIGGGVVVAALMPLSRPLAGLILDDPDLAHYLQLSFGALWFQILNRISLDYLRARQKAVTVVVFSLVRLLLALGLNIWFIVGMKIGVVGVLWSTLITAAVMFVVMTLPQIARVGLRFSRHVLGELVSFGAPMVVSQLGGMVVHLSDRFFIKASMSIADTGLYSLGYRLGTLSSMFVVEPFNQTWLPRRYEIHEREDNEEVFGRIFTYYVAALVFFALAISALAADLLKIIAAPAYWGAADVVPIIAVANAVFALHYHLNFGLMLAKRTKLIAAINLTNAALVLLLNWQLIPRFGVYGAAYATLAAFVFKVSVTWYFSRQIYTPRFEPGRLVKAVGVAALLYVAARMIQPGELWLSILVHMALVMAYPVVLWTTGFFLPEEKLKAGALLRRVLRR